MSSNNKTELDPYTAKAESKDVSPQVKIDGFKEVVSNAKTGMLTTRSRDGHLHSRAMHPIHPNHGENALHLVFIGNNVSGKFNEIENDQNVNVSFYDASSTNWASVAGVARVTQDKEFIKKHWSSAISGYFGDVGDGIHKGNYDDPRVSAIEVIPQEIRYWVANKGAVGRSLQVAVGAITGKGQAPGELRTIEPEEIKLVEGLHQK